MAEIRHHFMLALTALVLEAVVGYPALLQRIVPHPVAGIGGIIAVLERYWNKSGRQDALRRGLGILLLLLIVGLGGGAGFLIERLCGLGILGLFLTSIFATIGIAQKSLYRHVDAVRRALQQSDWVGARNAVAKIVGRDTGTLDESGVSAAALESLAESFNDGIVAPVFWLVAAGLPGLFAYKAVNTADSMIGHKESRWRVFGWASARMDDLLNFVPARFAGLLIVLAGRGGLTIMLRDAPKHDSPNAGWPEAAMAGALDVTLGGPVTYDGAPKVRAFFGDGHSPILVDLDRGLRLYLCACGLLWLLVAVGAALWPR